MAKLNKRLVALVFICLSAWVCASSLLIEFNERLMTWVNTQYGDAAQQRVASWEQTLLQAQGKDITAQLSDINAFFNAYAFVSDQEHWSQLDYWATPIEFIGTNAGDCEDYSIAKYVSLRAIGIPESKLRLVYVKAIVLDQAHMVLAYYPTPRSIPLILDNLNRAVLPADQRSDLRFIYSFNGVGLWTAKAQGRGRQLQPGGNNRLWADLHRKIEQQTPISIGE